MFPDARVQDIRRRLMRGESVLIVGDAGTGKSVLTRQVIQACRAEAGFDSTRLTVPQNDLRVTEENGKPCPTIFSHALFLVGPDIPAELDNEERAERTAARVGKEEALAALVRRANIPRVFVVDEIGLLSGAMLTRIGGFFDYLREEAGMLPRIQGLRRKFAPARWFRGKALLLVGDAGQLQPVDGRKNMLEEIGDTNLVDGGTVEYEGRRFYVVHLTVNHRQLSAEFSGFLKAVRRQRASQQTAFLERLKELVIGDAQLRALYHACEGNVWGIAYTNRMVTRMTGVCCGGDPGMVCIPPKYRTSVDPDGPGADLLAARQAELRRQFSRYTEPLIIRVGSRIVFTETKSKAYAAGQHGTVVAIVYSKKRKAADAVDVEHDAHGIPCRSPKHIAVLLESGARVDVRRREFKPEFFSGKPAVMARTYGKVSLAQFPVKPFNFGTVYSVQGKDDRGRGLGGRDFSNVAVAIEEFAALQRNAIYTIMTRCTEAHRVRFYMAPARLQRSSSAGRHELTEWFRASDGARFE